MQVQKLYLIATDFDFNSLVRLIGGFAPKGTHDVVVHLGELTAGRCRSGTMTRTLDELLL